VGELVTDDFDELLIDPALLEVSDTSDIRLLNETFEAVECPSEPTASVGGDE